jgi:hypothetical protein
MIMKCEAPSIVAKVALGTAFAINEWVESRHSEQLFSLERLPQ